MTPPPAYIDCGPYRYTVHFDADALAAVKAEKPDRDGWIGACDHRGNRILVDPSMAFDQQIVTLWHEVRHLIYYTSGGVRVPAKPTQDDLIEQTEAVEVAVLRQNPGLVAFLTQPR